MFSIADYERVDKTIKKHGRVEQRRYRSFTLGPSRVATPRWEKSGLCTLLCVVWLWEKGEVVSEKVHYYDSNRTPVNQAQADDLFDAIWGHWGIEVIHHKRDVSLSEDDLRTNKVGVSRLIGSLRTLVINLLYRLTVENVVAQLDLFADKFTTLIQFLTQQRVL